MSVKDKTASPAKAAAHDGRHARSADSRARIAKAFMELIREGAVAPTAESVAQLANVGLRTVFRHFRDMESLVHEIATTIEAELLPFAAMPFTAETWRGQIDEIIDRRSRLYERIMPFRIALEHQRYLSTSINARRRQFSKMQRAFLIRVLPAHVQDDADLTEGLDAMLGFESWQRMRQEQKLSPAACARVMRRIAAALLRDVPESEVSP